jgi:adenylosuccinate synthase
MSSYNSYAVIGLGFGDEGKGLVTDYLASTHPKEKTVVVRFSGGHQAGHTVNFDDVKHTFSNFGSGTLRGIPTFWSKYCTVDPTGINNEYLALLSKGIDPPTLYIDHECMVTTPYDKMANAFDKDNVSHGTCGVGFGKTIARDEAGLRLRVGHLYHPAILRMKLEQIREFYGYAEGFHDSFLETCERVKEIIFTASWDLIKVRYDKFIYEGSQGVLLDKDHGFFPHVTRSKTTTHNIEKMIYNPSKLGVVCVTRAYQTRHGNGPMSNTALAPLKIKNNEGEINITNEFQGKFRTSVLDLDLINYAKDCVHENKIMYNDTLVVTCLDQIEGDWRFTYNCKEKVCDSEEHFLNSIRLATGFRTIIPIRSDKAEHIKWQPH